jgi:RNA polymerase sigma-32 factor|tara:strand:+ start:11451 stop:12338 length:888 start_codon:yes stop_codon:yes gene_type:complete
MTKYSTALADSIICPSADLKSYISAVYQIPLLNEIEEKELAERLVKSEDLEAARRLVLSHLRVVVALSRQYISYGLPQGDIIQEGNLGLMKAIKRFDPSKGVRLFSFAIHWIKAEIHEFILRNWKIVKVATTKAHRKLFFNLRSLKRKLNLDNNLKNEDIGIIANELNVEYSDVVEMDKRLSCSDSPLESDGEGSSIIDFLEANNADPAEILADQQSSSIRKKLLMKAFKELDERSQTILKSRWLNVKEGKKAKTLKELASEFGISAERVRQLEVTAFGNLRKKITLDERDILEI